VRKKLARINNDDLLSQAFQMVMVTLIALNCIFIYLFTGPLIDSNTPNVAIAWSVVTLEIALFVMIYRKLFVEQSPRVPVEAAA
jgi:hypothetical protein